MSKPPAFQFYPDNFLQGVSDMSQDEVGSYILLLCHQWNHGHIPSDKVRVERIAHGLVTDHVMLKFKTGTDGLLRNERLELERDKQEAYRKSRAENGAKGGRPKAYGKHMVLKTKAQGKAQESSPSPSSSPSSSSLSDPFSSLQVEVQSAATSKALPTAQEDCRSYAKERGLPASDGEWFWDRGLSSGWKNNGHAIKDWKATFRTWQQIKILPSLKDQKYENGSIRPPVRPVPGSSKVDNF